MTDNLRRFPLLKETIEETTPLEALNDAIREIESGNWSPTGIIILAVEELPPEGSGEPTAFERHYSAAGPSVASYSRIVGWLEYFKSRFLASMGGQEW